LTVFDEAEAALACSTAGDRTLPVQRFKYHAARALLVNGRDRTSAVEEARAALSEAAATHSGLRYHSNLGLVGEQYMPLRRRLLEIAG
jgi:hypothetical protein